MPTFAKNGLKALAIATLTTAGLLWLVEIHLEIALWGGPGGIMYPLFFILVAGGMLTALNDMDLEFQQMQELDEKKAGHTTDALSRRRPTS